ncbi:hypothetical protein H7H80_00370, partial [Mycobacterium interjectum]|nr:hypothetical protein [Mycobacterium interjectum]
HGGRRTRHAALAAVATDPTTAVLAAGASGWTGSLLPLTALTTSIGGA